VRQHCRQELEHLRCRGNKEEGNEDNQVIGIEGKVPLPKPTSPTTNDLFFNQLSDDHPEMVELNKVLGL